MANKLTILVTGASGLVASRFVELYGDSFELLTPDIKEFDIINSNKMCEYLLNHKPDAVLHCAAYTDVSGAEAERDDHHGLVWRLNVDAVEALDSLCRELSIFLVHISTNAVFSGTDLKPTLNSENSVIETKSDMLSWYGLTKAEAERRLIGNQHCAIVRISYPVRKEYASKPDYIKKIISMADRGKLYPLFDDQYATLTSIDELSVALATILSEKKSGVFHVSSSNVFTPYELAGYILAKLRSQATLASASVKSFALQTKQASRYPRFAGLSVEQTQNQLGVRFSTWQEIVDTILS